MSGKHQPHDLRMFTVGGLPEIVRRLLGKVLPSFAEARQLKAISQISGYRGTPIEYSGQLPSRVT